MDFALGIVTLVALVMTLAMGVVTWRLVHEERRRSAARLAALEAELRQRGVPAANPARRTAGRRTASSPRSTPTTLPPVDVMIPASTPEDQTTPHELFGETAAASSGWSRQLVALGAAATVLIAAVALIVLISVDRSSKNEETRLVPAQAPVELLTLGHERQGSFLAISGSVRTSIESETPSPLSVQAMVYDEDGVMVASGRAPLELGALAEGENAPFSISLPADDAARYRVSFLSDETAIPHVDRRSTSTRDEPTDTETTSARHAP